MPPRADLGALLLSLLQVSSDKLQEKTKAIQNRQVRQQNAENAEKKLTQKLQGTQTQ